jgi:2-polyprenyl-3-methyl-5-hydroxy-6-metoxy-1,4-benzoquinol methylase
MPTLSSKEPQNMATLTIDDAKVEAFLHQIMAEAGAAMNAALVRIGDELGLYRAMADAQPVSTGTLAARTGTHERYVREWLNAQAAGGFVEYDPRTDRYTLPAEHAIVLADDHSPFAQAGLFQAVTGAIRSEERVLDAFRSGDGVGWHEHHHGLFHGVERLFGTTYRSSLVEEWIPALAGVEDKLRAGARVADVGCGHGLSTILLAEAYPNSTFEGYDLHPESIEVAQRRAAEAGVADRVSFAVAAADAFPRADYDVVAFFDALHDMGDPAGAARHVRSALAPDGTWMIVEPAAGDRIEDNLHPLGRISYAFSTLVCTPGSLSQAGRAGLGTLAGPARLSDVVLGAGFADVRVVVETPFNIVLEATP